ncbi:MAG: serine/threonine protein kinase [Myxococcales bacterium]|nr:MAG: serine/threonine protein kinase [Myxococcales bacterium]
MVGPRAPQGSAPVLSPARTSQASFSDALSEGMPNSRRCPACDRRFPAAFKVCPHDATPLEDAPDDEDPMIGAVLGGAYEVVRMVGEGGMGRVYEARHQRLPTKRFAVKMLHPDLARQPEVVTRFQREAEASSVVSHPNVVDVYDVSASADGRPYIVAELLQGEELGNHLDRVGKMTAGAAAHVVRQVCAALGAAHAAGIVHRDVKPENVFLAGGGTQVKVLDFGISKVGDNKDGLTKTGTVMGTPDYMAPEQARGDKVDSRADIYAVGAMLFRAVTGRKPFEGRDPMATLTAVLTEEPPRPSELSSGVPLSLELVIQKAMAKSPAERFQTMAELDAALAPFDTDGELIDVAPGSTATDRSAVATAKTVLRQSSATVQSANIEEATRTVKLARPGLVFFTVLGGLWLLCGALVLVGSIIRLIRGGADLTQTEAVISFVGALFTLATPGFLWITHLRAEVWPSTPRAIEAQQRLRRTVLYSAATAGIGALLVQVFEVVLKRNGGGLARPSWALFVIGAALCVGVGTWLASARKRAKD